MYSRSNSAMPAKKGNRAAPCPCWGRTPLGGAGAEFEPTTHLLVTPMNAEEPRKAIACPASVLAWCWRRGAGVADVVRQPAGFTRRHLRLQWTRHRAIRDDDPLAENAPLAELRGQM